MKKLVENNFIRKTVLALCIIVLIAFTIPQGVFASDDWDVFGTLLKEIVKLVAALGDIAMGVLNRYMLGTDSFSSIMLDTSDENLEEDSGSWLTTDLDTSNAITFQSDEINASFLGLGDDYEVPNILLSPESIFANNIAILDVNFLNPNEYTSVIEGYDSAEEASVSAASDLREVISSWYKSFRNIAIVGLLSVLMYLGIRIIISSTADDKAKYKESIKNWVVALCLVFIIHFIMSAILMITDKVTELFSTSSNSGFTISVDDGVTFKTNLIGLVRFQAQRTDAWDAVAYTSIYIILVVYTFRFTFMYFKRFLYTAFFTMIAPLVALTYPMDKVGDGKAQAFNMWFKEYTMNVIIQPVHLILYTVFVSSAIDLVQKNLIYAVVAIGFLIPAEKFIKKMFGFDKAETTGSFGAFAGGALAMSALQNFVGAGKKENQNKIAEGGNSSEGNNDNTKPIRQNRTIGNGTNSDTSQSQSNNGSSQQNAPQNNEESGNQDDEEVRMDDYDPNQQNAPQDNEESGSQDNEEVRMDDYDQNYLPEEDSENLTNYDDNNIDNNTQDVGAVQDDADSMNDTIDLNTGSPDSNSENSGDTEQIDNQQDVTNKGNKEKPPVQKGGRRKLLKKAAVSASRHVYKAAKVGTTVVGGMAGGVIGLATGIATGNPSSAVRNALTGASLGASFGRKVGELPETAENLGGRAINTLRNKIDGSADTWNASLYGREYARQKQVERENARARRNFLKDKNQQAEYEEMARKVGYEGNLDDFMNAAFDMRIAGIEDKDMQKNALKLEMKRDNGQVGGASHEGIMDVAAFANDNGYDKSYIEDAKKRKALEGVVQSMVSGEDNQMAVMQTFAELNDRGEYYRNNSGLGSNNNATNARNNNNTQSRRRESNPTTSQSRGRRESSTTTSQSRGGNSGKTSSNTKEAGTSSSKNKKTDA